jgi:spore germination protein
MMAVLRRLRPRRCRFPKLRAMRLLAAAAVLFAVVMALAGCGAQTTGNPTAIDLPASGQARAVITGSVAPASRRILGHPARSAASTGVRAGSGAGTLTGQTGLAPVAPLTPAANAKLNGVSVWIPYWGLTAATDDVLAHASQVAVAHPFTDEIIHSATVVDQSGGAVAGVAQELAAQHIAVIPTVTETAEMQQFAATLAHPRQRRALLRSLVSIASAPNISGIDLDFEDMAIGSGNATEAAQVATLYPRLVAQLCATLHQHNRSCEVTVMAKNTPGLSDGDGLNTGVYDYAALARVADRVQLMAYDDHVPSGAAGPVAPWPWVQSVLRYALTQIPAAKLVLGVPAYGYEWNTSGDNSSLTATGAESLAAQVHARVQWDATDAEAYFNYTTDTTTKQRYTVAKTVTRTVSTGSRTRRVKHVEHINRTRTVKHPDSHVVWFENSTADYDRAVLAADDKLAGIALWTGADESPGLWTMLKRVSDPAHG